LPEPAQASNDDELAHRQIEIEILEVVVPHPLQTNGRCGPCRFRHDNQCRGRKSSKFQAFNFQIPKGKRSELSVGSLRLWCLFGAWNLELGTYSLSILRRAGGVLSSGRREAGKDLPLSGAGAVGAEGIAGRPPPLLFPCAETSNVPTGGASFSPTLSCRDTRVLQILSFDRLAEFVLDNYFHLAAAPA